MAIGLANDPALGGFLLWHGCCYIVCNHMKGINRKENEMDEFLSDHKKKFT